MVVFLNHHQIPVKDSSIYYDYHILELPNI